MDNSLPASPLFRLARELRDKIYDDLLTSTIAAIPLDTPLDSNLHMNHRNRFPYLLWRVAPNNIRSSCSGLLYSCQQAYGEIVESIERHGGLSFEFELTVGGIAPVDPAERNPLRIIHWSTEVLPTWIVLPLYYNPNRVLKPEPQASHRRGKCRNLHVFFKVQYDSESRWTAGVGAYLPSNFFSLLARFLLRGPSGLVWHGRSTDASTSTMWDIDILSVHITGTGTTYVDPYNDELCTVPADAVMRAEIALAGNMERLCTSGALSGRVRAVKLIGENGNEREWLIDQGQSLSEEDKKDWAMYGWVIEPVIEDTWHEEEIVNIPADLSRQRHRFFAKLACCHLQ